MTENENDVLYVPATAIDTRVPDDYARVDVTYGGQQSELPDPVPLDFAEGDLKQAVTEALRAGDIPGLGSHPDADLTDYVVKRYPPHEQRPYNRIELRPKTPFGAKSNEIHQTVWAPDGAKFTVKGSFPDGVCFGAYMLLCHFNTPKSKRKTVVQVAVGEFVDSMEKQWEALQQKKEEEEAKEARGAAKRATKRAAERARKVTSKSSKKRAKRVAVKAG